MEAARKFVPVICHHLNLEPDDLYNMDEAGLCWKDVPSRALSTGAMQPSTNAYQASASIFFLENCSAGKLSDGKKAKDRITIVLCTNVTGTDRLPVLVLGTAKKPRAFKGWDPEQYVTYRANSKAWMTQAVSTLILRRFAIK